MKHKGRDALSYQVLQEWELNSSYSHVVHFRWMGEGQKLCHVKPGRVVRISKVEALPLLEMELMRI